MSTREKQTYRNLVALGWSKGEAAARAKIITAAEAGPCRCSHARHLPGDERCPSSPTYTPPTMNADIAADPTRNAAGFRTDL